MPTVAHVDPAVVHDLFTEGQFFEFGADGTRQVTEAERQVLERHMHNIGDSKLITFEETKPKSKGKGDSQ